LTYFNPRTGSPQVLSNSLKTNVSYGANPSKLFTSINKNKAAQSPSENQTVRYSNGYFPDTIFVGFSNGKIGHIFLTFQKTGPVFRPQYIGKAN
jgi:hypothetical protein